MAEYIEREALIKQFCERCNEEMSESSCEPSECFAREVIIGVPAVGVAPVRHGYWVGTGDGYADGELVYDMWACSECGFDADGADEKPDWKYCPSCGAKMDGGNDNG